jgi:hypothetical protein
MQRPDKDSFPGDYHHYSGIAKGNEIKSKAAVNANSSNNEIVRVSAESPRSSGDSRDEVLVLFTSRVSGLRDSAAFNALALF